MPSRNARFGGCVIVGVLLLAAVVALAVGGFSWIAGKWQPAPVPGKQRCVATAGGNSTAVSLEQAHYASIIAGLSVKRGLPPRAASIALATAYQESGIRNLDYGDRDSVGLFQQRLEGVELFGRQACAMRVGERPQDKVRFPEAPVPGPKLQTL